MGGAVTHDGPGDNVGAMVRARAGVLAETELERFNLQRGGLEGNRKTEKELDIKGDGSGNRRRTGGV